jgi:hypothetical protein
LLLIAPVRGFVDFPGVRGSFLEWSFRAATRHDDNGKVKLRVECYAGRKADERPVRFQLRDRDYMVDEVLDKWYGPGRRSRTRGDRRGVRVMEEGKQQAEAKRNPHA